MPVTEAPDAARRVVYRPGPHPKSATLRPGLRVKRETIQLADRSRNSVVRDETLQVPSRWNASIREDRCQSVQSSRMVS